MVKSFSQLKKDLKNSIGKTLKVKYHFRGNENGLMNDRIIARVQTNAFTTIREDNKKECWCYLPSSACLVEYIDNTFSIYESGYRELTEKEKALKEEMKHLITENERALDIYSDTNIEYWRQKSFAREHNCEYLLGFEEIRGLKYDFNTGKIRDNKIKGNMLYSFEIC